MSETLREALAARTRVGELWHREDKPGAPGGVRCVACGHRCFVPAGRDGICRVRSNRAGELRVPWGYVGGLQADPIEKKPFFHALPGATALSFGMLGCDFHCGYCQNWVTSQALRDPASVSRPRYVAAGDLAALAVQCGARVLTSTYNEPLITAEWAVEIFRKGRERGLRTSFVSNGNGTPEVLAFLRPHVDFYKIDLKGFRDRRYRELGGVLATVQRTIEETHRLGFWLEVVTLVVPGFNDDPAELRDLCRFLKGVSPDIPWHATACHPDYKMRTFDRTAVDTLLAAAAIGREEGLKFVYVGNLPGQAGRWESTHCPRCEGTLVRRLGFRVLENRLRAGACPDCGEAIPGVWD